MLKDLFQMANVLSLEDRMEIIAKLKKQEAMHPCCSACSSLVDIGFMRKLPGDNLNQAMCLPCFLQNHTLENQELIDKIVEIGTLKGWYHD
jgi:hypothetical protein